MYIVEDVSSSKSVTVVSVGSHAPSNFAIEA
jgi:hypothetical protein